MLKWQYWRLEKVRSMKFFAISNKTIVMTFFRVKKFGFDHDYM